MTFFTSYRSRSIGGAGRTVVCVRPRALTSFSAIHLARSVRGQAGGAAGHVDRDGEADPDEDVLLRSG